MNEQSIPVSVIARDAEIITALEATLAVEIAERNRYKNLSDKLVKVINGMRLPASVLAKN